MSDELFLAVDHAQEGIPVVKSHTREGQAAYQGVKTFRVERGQQEGDIHKGDLIVICSQKQKDDTMGQACKMLRDILGLITEVEGQETASGIEWCYNKFGHMEIWNIPRSARQADLYLQSESDVNSFIDHLGLKLDDISPGDCDTAEDPGYFNQ